MNRSSNVLRLMPYLALCCLVLLFLWRLAFTNGILARGDLLLYFYPYWDYRAHALAAGRLPLWNPLLFMGAPFLANSQAGVLYPFNWPLLGLSAPVAVKVSTLGHLTLAAAGTYLVARRAASLSILAAITSALLFALGGYVTAQIEHANQLQGLAWLPLLILGAHRVAERAATLKHTLLAAISMGAVLCLQLLAGHTQTAFISMAGAGLYAVVAAARPSLRPRRVVVTIVWLAGAVGLAGLLAAAQLLPTLELSSQSLRGGGLAPREALSFSLDPRLAGRALLPGYSRALFSEFVGYIGVAGLVLVFLGLSRQRLAFAVVAGAGLFFALGFFNPVYVGLAELPPFNLFRAPARWLALVAFGGAMLAGAGLDRLTEPLTQRRRVLALAAPAILVALTPLAVSLTPAGETGPLGWPGWPDWAGWGLALAVSAILLLPKLNIVRRQTIFAVFVTVELFAASRALPFNHVTLPEAYTSIRPAMTQLLASQQSLMPPAGEMAPTETLLASSSMVTTVASGHYVPLGAAPSLVPAGRFLSISRLRFDPGDLAELRSALEGELPADAFSDFVVATKHKEVLSPNLPLTWGVPAVDGYDGGVLPLRHYATFTTLFTGAVSTDGRLRENITSELDPRLLALVNARFLITDKVGDAWIEGVFFDLEFTLALATGQSAPVVYVPPFQATALHFVTNAPGGTVSLTTADGTYDLSIDASRVRLPAPMTPISITLTGPLNISGLSLVDERSGAFQPLTLGPYRLVHSGDVKVYEHTAALPRAFVASQAVVADDEAALALLSDPDFDPSLTVIIADSNGSRPDSGPPAATGSASSPAAAIVSYAPEAVAVRATGPGYLVLTDSHYPGWQAMVDGTPVTIHRADVMFRAVEMPAGEHLLEFRYQPLWLTAGLVTSAAAWASVGLAWIVLRRRANRAMG